jgi:phytoene desaturase
MKSKTIVIGSGFSGISAAAYLSAAGHEVQVLEKNSTAGGRARQMFTNKGYVFDMGPSWYWMPDVFEKFFSDFGYSVKDFYDLKQLDPSFAIIFGEKDVWNVPADYASLCKMFEDLEKGSSEKLIAFMKEAEYKYNTGIKNLVYKPGLSIQEFADLEILKGVFRMQIFSSFKIHVRKYFRNPKIISLMEFPVLFLGAMPKDTPALYSLMNYAGLKLGTWYPMGGFGKVIEAMKTVAEKNGARFHFDSPVSQITIHNSLASSVTTSDTSFDCDAVIASTDYHHAEQKLLPAEYRNYNEKYWSKKTFAPSSLIFYLGITRKIDRLLHHNLFFDENLDQHSYEIYKNPSWPTRPLFYACCTSKTDPSVAPANHENLFLLMPIATGLTDDESTREYYFNVMMDRLCKYTGQELRSFIDYKKSYCVSDFITDYNAYKGNAYGLANTLMQTAVLKPKIRNKKIDNLFYSGQLTVPGPGVPPSIISGKVAAGQLIKYTKKTEHEISI